MFHFLLYFLFAPCLHILLVYSLDSMNFTTPTTTTLEPIDFDGLSPIVYCKFQPNGDDCEGNGKFTPRFYYDLKMEACKSTTIGSCKNNLNAFRSISDCHNTCRDTGLARIPSNLSARIYCRLQHDFGNCNGYYPKWYYDITTRRCRGFSYSGCGGNLNRFATQQTCVIVCSGAMGN